MAHEGVGKPMEVDHPVGAVEIQPPNVEVLNADKEVESIEGEEEEEGEYTTDQLQFMMGLSLVVGFVFMLLVDQCGGGHSHAHVTGIMGQYYVVCREGTVW